MDNKRGLGRSSMTGLESGQQAGTGEKLDDGLGVW